MQQREDRTAAQDNQERGKELSAACCLKKDRKLTVPTYSGCQGSTILWNKNRLPVVSEKA